MTPQPDKIFRDALGQYRKTAPASAWDRIETGLDRRQSNGLWWKVAAGMLLLLASTFMLWPHPKDAPSVTLIQQDINQTELKNNTPLATSALVPKVSETPVRKVELIPDKKIKTLSVRNRSTSQSDVEDVEDVSNEVNEKENVVTTSVPVESITKPDPEVEAASVAMATEEDEVDESPGRNMIYTAQEVNARFIKKDLVSKATPEKNTTSGVKKVIDVAIGLKNNDSLLGDLRQLKNEYLTINFPDKKRDPTK